MTFTTHRSGELLDLETRLRALEASIDRRARAASRRTAVTAGLLPLLVLAGWAVAQTTPVPGESATPDASQPPIIEKGEDGVTRVSAPFEVVDASGRVILSVASDNSPEAAISVWVSEGAGNVAAFASGGAVLAQMGRNTAGFGTFVAHDAQGKPRAFMFGNGGFVVHSDSGKQVAAMAALQNKGVVGVWGGSAGGERVAALSEASDGGGALTVFDKAHQPVVVAGSDSAGSGALDLYSPGKSEPTVALGIVEGSGLLSLENNAGQEAVVLTGAAADGAPSLVLKKDERPTIWLSNNKAGAGSLALYNAEGGSGLEAVGAPASTPGRGGAIAVFKDGAVAAGMGTADDGSGLVTVEGDGKVLAEMSRLGGEGGGQLLVRTAAGKMSAHVADGSIAVLDDNEDPLAWLERSEDGRAGLGLSKGERVLAEMRASETDGSTLSLRNPNGKIGVEATAGAEGGGLVAVLDDNEVMTAAMTVTNDKKGQVAVFEQGASVAEMRGEANGSGYLHIADAAGKVTLGASGTNGTLTALNGEKIIATLGRGDGDKGRIATYGASGVVAELTSGEAGGGLILARNAEGAVTAGITGSSDGAGAVVVRKATGEALAEMSGAGGAGQVKIFDSASGRPLAVMARTENGLGGAFQAYNSSTLIAHLGAGQGGGGFLQLTDVGGTPLVEGGGSAEGLGVVQAGPNFVCDPRAVGAGLKNPDCIIGRK